MNLEMLLSRDPQDILIVSAEFDKISVRMTEALPVLGDRQKEFLQEYRRLAEQGGDDYLQTKDWEIDLGVFLNSGKIPPHFGVLEFYARLIFYQGYLQNALRLRLEEVENRLLATADHVFFHLKDLASEGNEEARKYYEELKALRPGGDKP